MLIPSYLIPFYQTPSNKILHQPIEFYPTPSPPISSNCHSILSYLIPLHNLPSHLVTLSYIIPSHPTPSNEMKSYPTPSTLVLFYSHSIPLYVISHIPVVLTLCSYLGTFFCYMVQFRNRLVLLSHIVVCEDYL